MKSLAIFALLLLAYQAAADDSDVTIQAEGTDDLIDDEMEIVNSVTTLLTEFVKSKGDVAVLQPLAADMREKAEKNMREKGPEYLETLADILSRIYLPDETVEVLAQAINSAA